MKKLTSKELREEWLKFFESKDHLRLESKSLIPINDDSLLWINSGVATLKDYFSGKKMPPKKRLTNSQKSIRTNDIENVGETSRHHTFFEMLGNFSIGDYFKNEAIEFAWEFLTKTLEMPTDKLYITYYQEDKDTYNKWIEMGVNKEHLIAGDKEMNFWDMGLGPCGPDTEIFFDKGEKYDKRGIELIEKDLDNDRYIEIWNVVFSEFNNDGEGNYIELSQKNIDTGAGLERIVSILQGGHTNFETDLFLSIIQATEKLTEKRYDPENYFTKEPTQTKINKQFRVIADHLRAVVNAISDGAKPSNVSRGYIIRRLIRRAYRAGMSLGIKQQTFLFNLTQDVVDSLPFKVDVNKVSAIIKKEEETFAKTIEKGEELLSKSIIPGKAFDFATAFKLFETYGFPIELTQEILAEKNVELNLEKFEEYRDKHAEASRGKDLSANAMQKQTSSLFKIKDKVSTFTGYETEQDSSNIVTLLNETEEIDTLDGVGFAVFESTPFYATSGGQRHDKGFIIQSNGNKAKIIDVFKDKFGNHIHKVDGKLTIGPALLEVDHDVRNGLMRNHSGTHLLFNALRETYGDVIEQLGSDNNEERLRFDFPCNKRPTEDDLNKIENLVNKYIKMEVKRDYIVTDIKSAEEMGAIMTVDEYNNENEVRVVDFPGITKDLCGGTHVPNTKVIEAFKIISVDSKGSGVFRIEAITSKKTISEWEETEKMKYQEIIDAIITKNKKIDSKYTKDISFKTISQAQKLITLLKKDNKKLKKQVETFEVPEIENIGDLYINLTIDSSHVKKMAISLREKYPKTTFAIGSTGDKIILAITSKVKNCGSIFSTISAKASGRGGGSSDFAQGAVDNIENIENIINEAICQEK